MKNNYFVGVLVLCAMISWGCLSAQVVEAKNEHSIKIKGSDTMVNLVQMWAEEYMKENPKELVAVTGGGSGTGVAALIGNSCDIAMSSRTISDKEIALAQKKGVNPKEAIVALDGLAVVVHPKNPVSKLTLDQLAGIFSGKIKRWKEVGGTDENILLLSREVNSGTHVYFKEHVIRKGDKKSKEEFSAEALLLPSSQAIADEIKNNVNAIGYYGMGYVGSDHQVISVAKTAGEDFIEPTEENVVSGHYPISRPLFFYTNGEPKAAVKAFYDFIQSPKGVAIIQQADFVPSKN